MDQPDPQKTSKLTKQLGQPALFKNDSFHLVRPRRRCPP